MLAVSFKILSGISIHAPREGGDYDPKRHNPNLQDFNPRPPRGGRRPCCGTIIRATKISIHAPREGGDENRVFSGFCFYYFNPRPPRGGRQRWKKIF